MNSPLFITLSVIYVLICIFLILVVLLQSGRGGGMGAAFGGGTQSVFGGAGAGNFLTRLTTVSAILFLLLSGTLAYLSSDSDSVLDKAAQTVNAKSAKQGKGSIKASKTSTPATKPAKKD